MKLNQLINPASLAHDINEGLIKVTGHPDFPLDIYNYTERAQYSKKWNKATTASRGLIVNRGTGDIVARPFSKFFNYEERPNLIGMVDYVVVTDKMYGSLGIMYQPEKDHAPLIATRGSFASDQALHGIDILKGKYPDFYPIQGYTYLFEIIYPENRIVLDYGHTNDLFILGAVNIETGMVINAQALSDWPGPKVDTLGGFSLREALSIGPRQGKEGLVVRSINTGNMLKIKQEDYIRLHRIVTGLNQRTVWEMLKEGKDPYEGVPDELHEWVSKVANNLKAVFLDSKQLAEVTFNDLVRMMFKKYGEDWTRGDFAQEALQEFGWLQKTLFLQLDNRAIDEYIWNQLKPSGEDKSYAK